MGSGLPGLIVLRARRRMEGLTPRNAEPCPRRDAKDDQPREEHAVTMCNTCTARVEARVDQIVDGLRRFSATANPMIVKDLVAGLQDLRFMVKILTPEGPSRDRACELIAKARRAVHQAFTFDQMRADVLAMSRYTPNVNANDILAVRLFHARQDALKAAGAIFDAKDLSRRLSAVARWLKLSAAKMGERAVRDRLEDTVHVSEAKLRSATEIGEDHHSMKRVRRTAGKLSLTLALLGQPRPAELDQLQMRVANPARRPSAFKFDPGLTPFKA